MSVFGDLERLIDDLYPYRWAVVAGLALLLALVAAVAVRLGALRLMARHRLAAVLIAVPLLAVTVPGGYYLLAPLWQRSHLEEMSPLMTVAVAPAPAAAMPAAALTPVTGAGGTGTEAVSGSPVTARVTQRGSFTGADDFHYGRGRVLLIETAPGRHTVRFEEFSVRNGPDLYVYLSPSATGFAEGALNLGRLKATDGSFNYEVPAGTDLSRFKSVIIWCRRFSVLFATAPLAPAQ
jgi:hypothetical protein